MNLSFLSNKKIQAVIVTAISGAVLYFFPGAADTVGQVAHYLADVATAVADKVQPATVVQP